MAKKTSRRIKKATAKQEKVQQNPILMSITGEEEEGAPFDPPYVNKEDEVLMSMPAKRSVQIMKDHSLEFPDLYAEAWLIGPPGDKVGFPELLTRSSIKKAKTMDSADFVIFTGGEDVDPALYGESKHHSTSHNPSRDTEEITAYLECLEKGIPMIGVCRGAQFLHVMNGGKLYQHVDNHYGDHSVLDLRTKERLDKVSSVHHQMVRENLSGGMTILATAAKSRKRCLNAEDVEEGLKPDIEAFFYRDTCCLGVQGHPEYRGYNRFAVWFMEQINEYVFLNPDTDWVEGNRRMHPDLLEQRKGEIINEIKGVA